MTSLVTLEEAKRHLRVIHDSDDADIALKIEAASELVLEYIGEARFDYVDSSGDISEDSSSGPSYSRLKQATLLLLGDMYLNREPSVENTDVPSQFGYGYLPRAVVALLYPLRKPVVVS